MEARREAVARRAVLSGQDSSVLLSWCVIKALWEGWSSRGSSGLHMWPRLIVVHRDLRLASHRSQGFVFRLVQTLHGQHMAVDNANCPFYPGLTSPSINKPCLSPSAYGRESPPGFPFTRPLIKGRHSHGSAHQHWLTPAIRAAAGKAQIKWPVTVTPEFKALIGARYFLKC